MKTLGLLLLWSVTWLPAGGHDHVAARPGPVRRSAVHLRLAELDRPVGRLPLGFPIGESLGALLWDEEDGSDGDPVDAIAPRLPLEVSGVADRAALALFALSQGSAVWTSCQRHPLRC